ncbi:2-oxo-4-hydroxy-4-carboxy-5-ureidoimidazoline decarboxylase [Natrialba taiwanensis]|nr:2-oxo-4-hydroxy-4-carboxy-5-ureidoimidazoline decarboxylase [Natrialba taiwanensis]
MTEFIIEELNQFDEEHFVDTLDDVYEESPWVAKQVASERPFDSREDLRATMESVVNEASRDRKLELLRAHPDLGEQTEMTEASQEEQSSAGLDELQPEQYKAFQQLNETYRETFGFPFIMAVKGKSPDEIQTAMENRINNSESDEFRTALGQVHEIARLRLEDRITQ